MPINIHMNLSESRITQKSQECFDFWFKNVGIDGHNHGYMSKSCFMFEHILPEILHPTVDTSIISADDVNHTSDIKYSWKPPTNGNYMQLGTNFGVSFDILYRKYGNRCIGVDLWNPLNHPNIIERNMYDLEDIPLAVCNIDTGDFRWTPKLRKFSIKYAIRNMVKGGIIITAGGDFVNECLGLNLSEYLKDHGFTIANYRKFTDKTPLPDVGIDHELIAISS